jgi:hypothetical protein
MRMFRLLLIGAVLLLSVYGRAATAANCSGGGSFTMSLTPCPIKQIVRSGTAGIVGIQATANKTLPSQFYVVLSGDINMLKAGSLSAVRSSNTSFYFEFDTSPSLAPGHHTGSLQVMACAEKNCVTLYSSATLPFDFSVVQPPAITAMSPGSVLVGAGPFTLKLAGRFTSDCRVRLGNQVLPTKFVSATQLTATVDLASVNHGQSYTVTVVPATGFTSNSMKFVLDNPVPVMTHASPTTALMGDPPFTLTVKGSHFVSTSSIKLGSTVLDTRFVSSTELTAKASFASYMAGGQYGITVTSPIPGGGKSRTLKMALEAPVPTVTSLSPNAVTVPTVGFQMTVNGSHFQPNSVVRWNGVPVQTVQLSTTQLLAWCPFGGIQSGETISVDVMTPGPGGGTSSALTLTAGEAAPQVSWIAPTHVYTDSGDLTVSAVGTHFDADTKIYWNGTALATTTNTNYAGRYYMQATLPAALIGSAGTAQVKLLTPAPGGGSVTLPVAVTVHPPEIDSLSPADSAPGAGDFTLTVYGAGFDQDATVYWNGDALTTTYVSATELQAAVPAADVSDPGVAKVMVQNPAASGGTSSPASFAVDASGTSVQSLAQPVNDVVWDSAASVFYGSVPASDANYPHSIVTVDPFTAGVTASADTTSEPTVLAVAQDGSYVYAGISTHIKRLVPPAMTLDLDINAFGQAKVMQVSPQLPHVVGISVQSTSGSITLMQASILMDASGMPPGTLGFSDAMVWSADGSHLYHGQSNGGYFRDTSSFIWGFGATFQTASVWDGTRMQLDAASGLVYGDGSPSAIDPASRTVVATYPVSGVMAPDSSLGCAYVIAQTQAQIDAAAGDWTLSCYSTLDQTLTRSLVIPAVTGTPTKMMRWGNEGLMFMTDGGYLYFVSGQVVTGN